MSPKVRFGLLVGGIGAVLNLVVSTLFGFCGPLLILLAGALAGGLTARAVVGPDRAAGATQGALAGAIAGSLMLIGQVLGALGALLFIQSSGAQPLLGRLPTTGAEQGIFWAAGLGVGLCFGIVGLVLGAGAGAGAGYLAWRAPADTRAASTSPEIATPQS